MAKKNRNRGKKPQPQSKQTPSPKDGISTIPSSDISALEDLTLKMATEVDLQSAEDSPTPEVSKDEGLSRIQESLKIAEAIQTRLEKEIDDAETKKKKACEDADKEKMKAREERESLKSQRKELQIQTKTLDDKEAHLSEKDTELEEREKSILEREIDANKGFPKRYIEELENIQQAHETFKEDYSNKLKEFEAQQQAESLKQAEAQAEWHAAVEERETDLDSREKSIRKKERDLQREKELIEEDREEFEHRVETAVATERENFKLELKQYKERLENAKIACDKTDHKLQKLEEIFRCFQPKSPEDIQAELNALKDEKRKLQLELDNRLSSDSQARLQALERENETADAEKADLRREIARKDIQLAKLNISATELETAKRQADSYKANIDTLNAAIEESRKTMEQLIGKKSDIVFPTLTEMDTAPEFETVLETKSVNDLNQLAITARNAMAQSEDPRYYYEITVRSFIGGLAMSRLHLLHGISGTGKTSLPLAFAKAIGAGVELIEVQAGWRDRNDLFGYYNSFEKKYYEEKFLQALYKAQCPAFRDRPFFIILDEMNLSHPEQYFADILSALEKSKDKHLTLMTAGVKSAPRGLGDNGTYIELPNNVWFIGTANQDETTKDFADKSYDRAHVMELTGKIDPFSPKGRIFSGKFGLESIQQAFDHAAEEHLSAAEAAWGYLNSDDFKTPLQRDFQIGWGPRLQRQLNRYLPAVISSGGSKGEALDHIIASKILRKIQNRYNNRREHLESLKTGLEESWENFDHDSLPDACIELLDREILKVGGDV